MLPKLNIYAHEQMINNQQKLKICYVGNALEKDVIFKFNKRNNIDTKPWESP